MPPPLIDADAEAELIGAAAYYEEVDRGRGRSFLVEFQEVVRRIEALPQSSSVVLVLGDVEVRRFAFEHYPYSVFVVERAGRSVVIAVAHDKRKPGYWKDRLHR